MPPGGRPGWPSASARRRDKHLYGAILRDMVDDQQGDASGPTASTAVEDDSPPEEVRSGSNFTLIDAEGETLADPSREDIRSRLEGETFFWLDLHAPTADDIDALGE